MSANICCFCLKNTDPPDGSVNFKPPILNLKTYSVDEFLKLIPDEIINKMNEVNFPGNGNKGELKTERIIADEGSNSEYEENRKEIYYHGEFNDKDEQEGIGKMIIINENKEKTIYHGIWEKNELKKGIIYYNDNSKYKGDIKNLLRHGKGTYTSEAETYEGNWVEDKKEGEGFLTFKDKI